MNIAQPQQHYYSQAPQSNLSLPFSFHSNKNDLYLNSILYSNHNSINHYINILENLPQFRLIILHDNHSRSKQLLFDTNTNSNHSSPSTPSTPSTPIPSNSPLNSYNNYSLNELSTYIFGNHGILLNSTNHNNYLKINHLPPISNNLSNCILISNIFTLNNSIDNNIQVNDDWSPKGSILASNKKDCQIITNKGINNGILKLSISIIIPIQSFASSPSLNKILFNNWLDISFYFQKLRSSVRKRLLPFTNSNTNIVKIPYLYLQNCTRIANVYNSFINHLIKLFEINRLFIDLANSKFQLINWSLNINSWMNYKLGNDNSFLSILLSILLPIKENLLNDNISNKSENYRLIIKTNNPNISQRLIFIIYSLLSYNPGKSNYQVDLLNGSSPSRNQSLLSYSPESNKSNDLSFNVNTKTKPIPTRPAIRSNNSTASILTNSSYKKSNSINLIPFNSTNNNNTTPTINNTNYNNSNNITTNNNDISLINHSFNESYSSPTLPAYPEFNQQASDYFSNLNPITGKQNQTNQLSTSVSSTNSLSSSFSQSSFSSSFVNPINIVPERRTSKLSKQPSSSYLSLSNINSFNEAEELKFNKIKTTLAASWDNKRSNLGNLWDKLKMPGTASNTNTNTNNSNFNSTSSSPITISNENMKKLHLSNLTLNKEKLTKNQNSNNPFTIPPPVSHSSFQNQNNVSPNTEYDDYFSSHNKCLNDYKSYKLLDNVSRNSIELDKPVNNDEFLNTKTEIKNMITNLMDDNDINLGQKDDSDKVNNDFEGFNICNVSHRFNKEIAESLKQDKARQLKLVTGYVPEFSKEFQIHACSLANQNNSNELIIRKVQDYDFTRCPKTLKKSNLIIIDLKAREIIKYSISNHLNNDNIVEEKNNSSKNLDTYSYDKVKLLSFGIVNNKELDLGLIDFIENKLNEVSTLVDDFKYKPDTSDLAALNEIDEYNTKEEETLVINLKSIISEIFKLG